MVLDKKMGPKDVLPIRFSVNLEVMAMKEYYIFPKDRLTIRYSSVSYQGHSLGGILKTRLTTRPLTIVLQIFVSLDLGINGEG